MGKRRQPKEKQPQAVEQIVNDSDDEEIDEDEAFNSDDDRKYGSFFDREEASDDHDSESEEDSGIDDESEASGEDSDAEEDDGGQYMVDLLQNLDDKNSIGSKKATSMVAAHVQESPFASSVIPNAQLTLDSLMEGLKDTKGYGTVQKAMKHVAQGQATSAPLAKVVADRIQRKVNYEIQSKEISLWSKAVHENRKAETLDFRPKQRLEVSRDMLIDQFVPTTDYEKQIHAALSAAEQDEEAMLKSQEDALDDDLGSNTITLEEYKKRRGQLAKMRALMFYHEQKRHHINKIKSKKYRKIRKKQKERFLEAEREAQMQVDPDKAKELEEKEEIERMKERATLAHKNTSKWAKRILKRGKNVDADTRRALSAQLQRGDDLRQRMMASRESDSDDDDEHLVSSAREILEEVEVDTNGNDADGKGKGLFQLAFMKKGLEKQRERAKEEARQLLMELEADDDGNDVAEDDLEHSSSQEQSKVSRKKVKVTSEKELRTVMKDGEMMVDSLKYGNSSAVAMDGTINIDVGLERNDSNLTSSSSKALNERTDTVDSLPISMTNASTTKFSKSPAKKRSANRTFVDVDRAVDLLDSTPIAKETRTIVASVISEKEPTEVTGIILEKKITTLTQEELVQRAFANPVTQEQMAAADDDDDSFTKEKARVEEEEDPIRRIKKEKEMKVSMGWGSWAGQGVKEPILKKAIHFPKKLQPPPPLSKKRPRADAKKPNVIISEKRIKKLADKYMLTTVPYPYTSREEYERSMVGGMGREWNVTDSFKDMTRPEILVRAGKMIQPLSKKVKQARAPAKF
jgi:U3 small nucleolar RNA-associated protein 14